MRALDDYTFGVAEVCERYRVSKSTIALWLDRNMFPIPVRVGRRQFWTEADLDLFDSYLVARSKAEITGIPAERPEYSIAYPESCPVKGRLPAVTYGD